jgi:septal ring factor EnvC (AmiA/AmiB activator)
MPRADMAVVEDIHQDATTQPVQLEAMPVELMRAVNAIREDMTVMASTLERTQAELRDERKAREVLADENEELRQKMGVLENELVRLRKDRRELETYLVDKFTKLRNR